MFFKDIFFKINPDKERKELINVNKRDKNIVKINFFLFITNVRQYMSFNCLQ